MPIDDALGEVRRILVYGVTGSGKTVLAERLSRVTSIRWHSVDDLTWDPGWVSVPDEEQRRRIFWICEQREWILDTAYSSWLDIPLARADLVVALDYPRWFSLQRLLRRTVARILDKKLVCNGNIETLRSAVARDSILVWHFRSFKRKRERIQTWMRQTDGPRVVRLTNSRQAAELLAGLSTNEG